MSCQELVSKLNKKIRLGYIELILQYIIFFVIFINKINMTQRLIIK